MDTKPTVNRLGLTRRLHQCLLVEALVAGAILGSLLLLSLGPRLIGYSSFVVLGGSMEPHIHRGSIAVGRPVDAAALKVGDIIVFRATATGVPTVHRIVQIEDVAGGRQITTKGDANPTADPQPLLVNGKGSRIAYTVPYIGYLLHPSAIGIAQTKFTLLIGVGLAGLLLWEIWKPASRTEPSL